MRSFELYGLEEIVNECHSIAWDGCHKVYALMDAEQTQNMRDYEYEFLVESSDSNPYDLLEQITNWYESSCNLKFIDVVYTENNETEFYALVAQGESILEVM